MELFSDFKLNPKILKAVQEAGYEKPTPIQNKAIPAALEGKDVLGIAPVSYTHLTLPTKRIV